MFRSLEKQLKKLSSKEIVIAASGTYPKGTSVQAVCFYQNDGTDTIKAANFVELAESKYWRKWEAELARGIEAYLWESNERRLMQAGKVVAKDIGRTVNRIDTRRLKRSMRAKIES